MIMRKIEVISRKYDGTLRDTYQSDLYAETDESLTLFSLPGNAFWHPRKSAWLKAPDGLIEIYFKHKWYNIWHICEQMSGLNRIYVNIAMPVTFRSSKLEWIDLDLDYRLHLDDSIEQLDQAEFEQNVQRMNYPAKIGREYRISWRAKPQTADNDSLTKVKVMGLLLSPDCSTIACLTCWDDRHDFFSFSINRGGYCWGWNHIESGFG
jgi:protein associated with RNAse G/E